MSRGRQPTLAKMTWHPIAELDDIYRQPIWIGSPKLLDGDSNPTGAAEAYWQDTEGPGIGEWRTTRFDMCNDEWITITLAKEDVTHFLIPEGPWSADVPAPSPELRTALVEPFGYWIEQKGAEPALLCKPAYIPEPGPLRSVAPVYAADTLEAISAENARLREALEKIRRQEGFGGSAQARMSQIAADALAALKEPSS